MNVPHPQLDATEFTNPPTEEELMNLMAVHKEFWTRICGVLFACGKYSIADQQQRMNKLLGVAVQLQMTIDAFRGQSQIAQVAPHLVRQ